MARNPRSRASKAGNRKALQAVRAQLDDVDDLYAGLRNQDLDKLAAERAERGGKFLGTDERGLPTMSRLTPEQEAEAAAGYAEKLKDKPGFEEAARVTAEGRLPGMPDDLPETTGRALAKIGVDDMDDMGQLPAPATEEPKAEEKLDVEPMNWTGYGGFEYSVDPARPDQIKINGKLFTDEKLREVTRKRGKEVGIEDIMLEKSDIESKGIKIAPRAKETPTARRRRIAEQALTGTRGSMVEPGRPDVTMPDASASEEPPTPEAEDFMTGAGAFPKTEGPSLQEAFAGFSPESYAGETFAERAQREKALDDYIAASRKDKQSDPEVMEARRRAVLASQPPDLSESYAGETFAERAQREKALAQSDATMPAADEPSGGSMLRSGRADISPPDRRQSPAEESFVERYLRRRQ